jgi:phage baseplate assembly protein W
MSLYRGFSTVNELSQKKFKLTDFELIKQDLLNSLNTRLGSRLMLPTEGCVVWDLLYEPLTQPIVEQIRENLFNIVKQDPRVEIDSLNVQAQEDQNSITVEINLRYSAVNQLDRMLVTFTEQGAFLIS